MLTVGGFRWGSLLYIHVSSVNLIEWRVERGGLTGVVWVEGSEGLNTTTC